MTWEVFRHTRFHTLPSERISWTPSSDENSLGDIPEFEVTVGETLHFMPSGPDDVERL